MRGMAPPSSDKQYDFIVAHQPPYTCSLINTLPTIPTAEHLGIYEHRASLPLHCSGERWVRLPVVVPSALTWSWLSSWVKCGAPFHPVGVQMEILRFDWDKTRSRSHCLFHLGADKNSSSFNVSCQAKKQQERMYRLQLTAHKHAQIHTFKHISCRLTYLNYSHTHYLLCPDPNLKPSLYLKMSWFIL